MKRNPKIEQFIEQQTEKVKKHISNHYPHLFDNPEEERRLYYYMRDNLKPILYRKEGLKAHYEPFTFRYEGEENVICYDFSTAVDQYYHPEEYEEDITAFNLQEDEEKYRKYIKAKFWQEIYDQSPGLSELLKHRKELCGDRPLTIIFSEDKARRIREQEEELDRMLDEFFDYMKQHTKSTESSNSWSDDR